MKAGYERGVDVGLQLRRQTPGEFVGQRGVDVVAAESRVAVGGEDLENAFVQFEDGDVERAAAEIVDRDFRFLLEPVEAVGQRGGGRFVDDALDVESGEAARFLGGVALRVVEVGRDGDDRARDRFAERALDVGLQFLEHLGRNFLGRPGAARQFDADRFAPLPGHGIADDHFFAGNFAAAPAHETLDGRDGFARLETAHALGGGADQRRLVTTDPRRENGPPRA